jgi:hypothetical protein
MKRAGRIHPLSILGIAGVVVIAILFFLGRSSPMSVAGDFMLALAKADTKKLADLSYMQGLETAEIEKKWDFTVNTAAPHYRFIWRVLGSTQASDEIATVKLELVRNLGPSSYPENFEIPMVKKSGKWLVDVRSINREFFPALPR